MTEPRSSARHLSACHTLVFIGGLHRSGTSPLARILARHPHVSGFTNTGVPEDEGQHLQNVYEPAIRYGGAGKFGFHSAARLVEESPQRAPDLGRRLFSQWAPHWDLERAILLEKSPPNLLRVRYLQSLFPGAAFVMILRHPVEVSLATRRASGERLGRLLRHWFVCHDIFCEDSTQVKRLHVVRYEDLVSNPSGTVGAVLEFLGLSPHVDVEDVASGASDRYRSAWRAMGERPPASWYRQALIRRFEPRAARYGYSLADVDRLDRSAAPWASAP